MKRDLAGKMTSVLPPKIVRLIALIGEKARDGGSRAYLTGGFVRDLVMGRANKDVDIMVERDAIGFAEQMACVLNASIAVYPRFGTATLFLPPIGSRGTGGLRVDLTTARRETYKKPAVLPDVAEGDIKDDLFRRDFTINAMAVSISPGEFGALVDPYGGERDIGKKIIRVLHPGSFIDDPTRIFRAVRFEQRLGFKIETGTKRLIRTAVREKMFDKISGERLRNELVAVMNEKYPERCFSRMSQLDEIRFISPGMKLVPDCARVAGQIRKDHAWYAVAFPEEDHPGLWIAYLMLFMSGLTSRAAERALKRLIFSKDVTAKVMAQKSVPRKEIELLGSGRLTAAGIYDILKPLPVEAVLFLYSSAGGTQARKYIRAYLRKYRYVVTETDGNALHELGVRPGPFMGKLLREILRRKLEGKAPTKERELGLVRDILSGRERI
ncbi:MAG: hypothetical protein PHH49_06910 [Candidatus Omnitrophica bacterium]|nr:hypothetical protein [Candidatus Omnitrophota bacterium]MDD5488668.1 hypothetical protein [Candidatus Omnitrophota bacterium]